MAGTCTDRIYDGQFFAKMRDFGCSSLSKLSNKGYAHVHGRIDLCTCTCICRKYPLFARTVSSDRALLPVLVALMEHYNWVQTAVLTSTDDVYFQDGLGLKKELEAVQKEVLKPPPFEAGNFKAAVLSDIKLLHMQSQHISRAN